MNSRRRLILILTLLVSIFFLITRLKAYNLDAVDGQGVRTDLALAIDERFPNSKMMRLAARQCALAFQKTIERPDDAWTIYLDVDKASSCIWGVGAEEGFDQKEARDIPTWLESRVVNTWAPSKAYLKYNAKLSGGTFLVLSGDLSNCNFAVE